MTLEDLGQRICIMGPSNSGKSTLAVAIARARGLEPIHLDQLHHQPRSNWRPRPPAEFVSLHDRAIQAPRWVIEGNYTHCLPQRLDRTTGVILLDIPTWTSILRYLWRSWFQRTRAGALAGGRDSVNWLMIRHIMTETRANRSRHRAMFEHWDLPKIMLATPDAINDFYRSNTLNRRASGG